MGPLASWAFLLALLLVAYVVIAEARGWLNRPTTAPTDDTDDDKD